MTADLAPTREEAAPFPIRTLSLCAALTGVALGAAVQVRNGHFDPEAIPWLAAGVLLTLLPLALPRRGAWERLAGRALPWALGLGFAYQLWQQLGRLPGIYLRLDRPDALHGYAYGLALLALAGLAVAVPRLRAGPWPLLLALVAFAWMGHWLLRTSPQPRIDVFTVHNEALAALWRGENPHAITYPDIYGGAPLYTPGLSHGGRIHTGFPYPPLSLLLAAAGGLLGDFRYALLAAMLAAAWWLARARPGPGPTLAALLLLSSPRALFVLEQGWTEPFVLALVAATAYAAVRGSRLLGVTAGLLLAVKQYVFLCLTAALLLPQVRASRGAALRLGAQALAAAVAVTLPLFLWGPRAFLASVVIDPLGAPFRPDGLNFGALLYRVTGSPLSPAWGFASAGLMLAAGLWRAPRSPAGFAWLFGAIFLVFVAFNRQAFCNYYYLVLGCMFVAAGLGSGPEVAPGEPETG